MSLVVIVHKYISVCKVIIYTQPNLRTNSYRPTIGYVMHSLCSFVTCCLHYITTSSSSSSMALQPGVGIGLHYNTPPSLSIPCSISPFVYSHLSQIRRHIIQPSRFWTSAISIIFPGCSMVWTLHVPNVKSVIPVFCLHRVLFITFRGLL
jgi:hypothetical protein